MSTLRQDLATLKVPAKYRKAIGAGLSAGVVALVGALLNGHGIDGTEWGVIAAAVLAPFGVAFKASNMHTDEPKG